MRIRGLRRRRTGALSSRWTPGAWAVETMLKEGLWREFLHNLNRTTAGLTNKRRRYPGLYETWYPDLQNEIIR